MNTEIRKDIEKHLKVAKKFRKDFKVRQSPNYSEMIFPNAEQKLIFNDKSQFKNGLFMFGLVKRDVKEYLQKNGKVYIETTLPVNYSNRNYDKSNKTIGIDLDHAYWRIAYLNGYITKTTYKKGLDKDIPKAIKLATLSCLGRSRSYDVYKAGVYSHTQSTESNNELIDLYNNIRQMTYQVMNEISIKLGNDFYCWKTDCIYFKDTKDNRKIAKKIIKQANIGWKYEE